MLNLQNILNILLFSRLSEYFLSRITIKNLSKSYGSVSAVTKFSVEIDSGIFLVLLGPSGCGKTTIIKSIAGLIDPTEGQIYIDNILINKLPPKDRDVAMVFQSYALYPHMSVYDNIAFPLKMRKFSKHEINNKVENTASLLELTQFLKRKPKELSGGQMQRVALARALVRNPKLFLMDEPLSNLDAKLRMQMRTEIKKLQKKIGITTIYITHDQIEAMSMADQIIVMNKGVIQQINLPLLEKRDSEIVLGIRPKDIIIDDKKYKKDPYTVSLKGKLLFTELLGDEVIYEIKLENNSIIKVSSNTDNFNYKQNDEIDLIVKYKNIHFFDSLTEQRLF